MREGASLVAQRRPVDREGSDVEKIWLKQYPAGVPAEIDVNEEDHIRMRDGFRCLLPLR